MATIKITAEGKIITKNGLPSCCCCFDKTITVYTTSSGGGVTLKLPRAGVYYCEYISGVARFRPPTTTLVKWIIALYMTFGADPGRAIFIGDPTYTSEDAEAAAKAMSPKAFTVNAAGDYYFFFFDTLYSDNEGTLTFRIYSDC